MNSQAFYNYTFCSIGSICSTLVDILTVSDLQIGLNAEKAFPQLNIIKHILRENCAVIAKEIA